ncbi:MAG: hypothetical protein FWJ92_12140 [Actinomycetes bacterium]|nr:hypothetical protein [Acidimicrobiia bacterium]
MRRTARRRPLLPTRQRRLSQGFAPDHPYVRRYWVAAIGQGAVAELLRLMRAARDETPLPLPIWLPTLLRADLVRVEEGVMVVGDRVPLVPAALQRRFSPGLREEHRRLYGMRGRRPAGSVRSE